MFEQLHLDGGLALGDPDMFTEGSNRFRGIAAAAQALDRWQARIVPSGHQFFADQFQQPSLTHDGIGQVQTGKFDLLGPVRRVGLFDHPVVERPVIFEFQGADRVRDALKRVREGMRIVVGRIEAPGAAGSIMGRMFDAVEDRVAQVDIGRGHVDFGSEGVGAVGEFAGLHTSEEVQVVVDGAAARGAVLPRLREGAAVGPHLVCRQGVDIGETLPDQVHRKFVEPLEIIRGEKHFPLPIESQPADVLLNGLDIFRVFGGRVGIVESQVADAARSAVRQAEV